jgi:ketosteroid isomerase-like protein
MSLSTQDSLDILQLYSRYNTAIDTGDGKTFANCFVEGGKFDAGFQTLDGHAAIAAFADGTHKALPGMRHNATNIVIDGAGDRATGSAFLIGYDTKGGYKVIVTGRYRDELAKTAQGWRFTSRIFSPDKPE